MKFWIQNKERKNLLCLESPHDLSNTLGLKWYQLLLPLSRTLSLFSLSCVCLIWISPVILAYPPSAEPRAPTGHHSSVTRETKTFTTSKDEMRWVRNKLFSFCLIVWKEKTTVARCKCLTKLLISFLSAEEVSRRGRCVWFGGQSRGEQDVQLAETWK